MGELTRSQERLLPAAADTAGWGRYGVRRDKHRAEAAGQGDVVFMRLEGLLEEIGGRSAIRQAEQHLAAGRCVPQGEAV